MLSLNGQVMPAAEARIDPADRGFLLGDGLFETMAIRGGGVRFLDRHLARLADGCRVIGMPVPDTAEAAIAQLLQASPTEAGSLRLTWSRGPGPRGLMPPQDLTPTLLITVTPGTPPCGPIHLMTARTVRRNEQSPTARIKCLSYLDNVLARQEAATKGADDALLLNSQGRVAETTIANLHLFLDGVWVTPPVSEGALPGVMRAALLESGLVQEGVIYAAAMDRVRAAVVSNSGGVRAVSSLDGRLLDLVLTSGLIANFQCAD